MQRSSDAHGLIVALILCFVSGSAVSSPIVAADAPRPNIVFVLVDDMGYADLGCMGATDIRTPPGRPDPKVTKQNMLHGSRADYGAMLERVDDGIGMILAELDAAGIAENTLVVLSSDNGGERWSDNRPLFHHKATPWEGGIRVPCVMRWPARLPAGKTISQMAITMDLTATFVAAASAKAPEGYQLDGINLLPILTGEQPETDDRTFCWRIARSNRKMRAVRHGRWKYVDDGGTMDLLFDLSMDIGERRNLGYTHRETVADLKARLSAWEAEMDSSPKTFLVR